MSTPKPVENIVCEADLTKLKKLKQLSPLGRILEDNRSCVKRSMWRKVFFAGLTILVVLNFVVPNLHPHFGVDKYPGFWPAFGLIVGVIMIYLVKKIVQPLIKRPEDYYGDL